RLRARDCAILSSSAFPASVAMFVVAVSANGSPAPAMRETGAGTTRGVVAMCRVTTRGAGPVTGAAPRQPATTVAHASDIATERKLIGLDIGIGRWWWPATSTRV